MEWYGIRDTCFLFGFSVLVLLLLLLMLVLCLCSPFAWQPSFAFIRIHIRIRVCSHIFINISNIFFPICCEEEENVILSLSLSFARSVTKSVCVFCVFFLNTSIWRCWYARTHTHILSMLFIFHLKCLK